jgi:xanthine dehydrogenase YagR molybdenum-binding subunit
MQPGLRRAGMERGRGTDRGKEVGPRFNSIGVKGVGEVAAVGAAGAIANAVYHATGKQIRDLPIRIEKLLA